MSRTEAVLTTAHREAAPALGQLALALASHRGVTQSSVADWAARLRSAADTLSILRRTVYGRRILPEITEKKARVRRGRSKR